jgi:hypothetical protein
MILTQFK